MSVKVSNNPKVTPTVLRGRSERLEEILGEGVTFNLEAGILYPGDKLCWFCGKNPANTGASPGSQKLSIWKEKGDSADIIVVQIPSCKSCTRSHEWADSIFILSYFSYILGSFCLILLVTAHWQPEFTEFLWVAGAWAIGLFATGFFSEFIKVRYLRKRGIRPKPGDYSCYHIVKRLLTDGWTLGDKPPAALKPQLDTRATSAEEGRINGEQRHDYSELTRRERGKDLPSCYGKFYEVRDVKDCSACFCKEPCKDTYRDKFEALEWDQERAKAERRSRMLPQHGEVQRVGEMGGGIGEGQAGAITNTFMSGLRKEMDSLPIEPTAFRDSLDELKPGCRSVGTIDAALEAVVSYLRRKETTVSGFHSPSFERSVTTGHGEEVEQDFFKLKDIAIIQVMFLIGSGRTMTFAAINIARTGQSEYLIQGHPTKFLS